MLNSSIWRAVLSLFYPPVIIRGKNGKNSENPVGSNKSEKRKPKSAVYRSFWASVVYFHLRLISTKSHKREMTRNAVDRKVSRVRIPNSPPRKACNHADYRLFYFCQKNRVCTIFGFQGRKSEVLPGTDRPPAAAEVAALRQGKPCLHRLCRGDLGLVIQVSVDIRRGGEVAVTQPLLNVLERHIVCQKQ